MPTTAGSRSINTLGRILRYFSDAYRYAFPPLKAHPAHLFSDTLTRLAARDAYRGGETTDTETAYRLAVMSAWVWSDIRLIADRVAERDARLQMQRRVDGRLEDIDDHPFEGLLDSPNSLTSGSYLLRYTAWWYLLRGNAYLFIATRGVGQGEPRELWPLPANMVCPLPGTLHQGRGVFRDQLVIDYEYLVGGVPEILPGENVIHFRIPNPFDWWEGLSPLTAALTGIQLDHAEQVWQRDFFREDNAIPTAFIALPADMNEYDFERLREDIKLQMSEGQKRLFGRAGDLKVEVISQTLEQMQIVDSRRFNRDEIDRIYGVPEGLVSGGLSGDSRLAAEIAFARGTVQPILDYFAEQIGADIAPFYGTDLILRAPNVVPQDRALAAQEYSIYAPDRTINENRQERGMEPVQLPPELTIFADMPVRLLNLLPQGAIMPGAGPPTLAGSPAPAQLLGAQAGKANGNLQAERLGIAEELRRWRRVAIKELQAGRVPAERMFESTVLSSSLYDTVVEGLEAVRTVEDVRALFDEISAVERFQEVTAGNFFTHKASVLTPHPHDNAQLERWLERMERESSRDIEQAFGEWLQENFVGITPDNVRLLLERTRTLTPEIREILEGTLGVVARQGVIVAARQFEGIGIGIAWDMPNAHVMNWATAHATELSTLLEGNTQVQMGDAISRWVGRGLPLTALREELEPALGRDRARRIAITEVTRAFARGETEAWQAVQDELGLEIRRQWATANDEKVCFICAPLGGLRVTDDGTQPASIEDQLGRAVTVGLREPFPHPGGSGGAAQFSGQTYEPPAHTNCRCRLLPVVGEFRRKPKLAVPATLPDGFPADLDRLEHVRQLGGSTGATLVRDPTTGILYVRKVGASPGHLQDEVYTDSAYQALGVNVPHFHLYTTAKGPVKLAEFIDGRLLSDLKVNDPAAYAKAIVALKKDFAADALLGNWDVLGAGFDNILVDAKGAVWRIDNGGGLRYRAQGNLKSAFGVYPEELWTMRQIAVNRQAAEIYGDLGFFDISAQLRSIYRKRTALLEVMPDDLRATVAGRLDVFKDVAKIAKTLQQDYWVENYVDQFARHSVGLRSVGIVERFPTQLTRDGVRLTDEQGRLFDRLRGEGSLLEDLGHYMTANGGDYNLVEHWLSRQASDSWSESSATLKAFHVRNRGLTGDTYWWKFGWEDADTRYQRTVKQLGEERYAVSFTIYHALNYEFMRRVKFTNNSLRQGVVKLIRTENRTVLRDQGLRVGESAVLKRGALESTSVFRPVEVSGSEVTVQEVPHHRVFANYMWGRREGSFDTSLMADSENEIVAMLEGITAHYKESR